MARMIATIFLFFAAAHLAAPIASADDSTDIQTDRDFLLRYCKSLRILGFLPEYGMPELEKKGLKELIDIAIKGSERDIQRNPITSGFRRLVVKRLKEMKRQL